MVSKIGFVDITQQLAAEVGDAHRSSTFDWRELEGLDKKIGELSVKVQLLAKDLEKEAQFKSQVTAKDVELSARGVAALQSTKKLESMTPAQALLQ